MTGEIDVLRAALRDRYAIDGIVGVGGMATVYRGRDVKHERAVAIKVLKPEIASVIGATRFLAEIRVTAGLQHPNILPLYDSGDAEGLLYYVMPLIDGESLRDRITRERLLPIDQAVEIVRAVASALESAHEQGVIHRDIKPENILLHRGQAMVTDFGIALAVRASGGSRLTETGLALGTPSYMSPEQALGERELDARTDVYALGAMLFEMIAGHPPFTAATAQGVVAKVIAEPAAHLTAERPTVPEHVSAVVRTALEKLPADRFPTVRAFSDALVNPTFSALAQTRSFRTKAAVRRTSWKERVAVPSLVVGALALAAAGVAWFRRPASAEQSLSYVLSLPPEQGLQVRYASRVAISPDGSRIVFVGPGAQGVRLFLRERSQLESTPIPGTEGAVAPFFSPDGTAIGFLNVGRQSLQVVTLGGGAVRTVVASGVRRVGASWDREGIVFVDDTKGLMRWSPADSTAKVLLKDDSGGFELPQSSPDGRSVVFRRTSQETGEKELALLHNGIVCAVARGVAGALPENRRLVYATGEGNLMAAELDPSNGKIANEVVVARGVEVRFDAVDLAVSPRALVYGVRSAEDLGELVLIAPNGAVRPVDDTWLANFQSVSFSPDGSTLATTISVRAGEAGVWTRSLQGGVATRISDDQVLSFREAWHPTDGSIGFIQQHGEARDFWRSPSALPGATVTRVLLPDSGEVNQAIWSRDGRWLLYRTGRVNGLDIKALRLSDSSVHTVAASPTASEHSPTLSPDGRWVAFVSDRRERRNEVYVRPFPQVDRGEWQVSISGGTEPRWSADGRELYFKQGLRLVAISVLAGEAFAHGPPRHVMSVDGFYSFAFHPTWDITAGGTMAMIRARHQDRQFDVAVMQGWESVSRQ